MEGLEECFGSLRESGVRGESAALNGRGEGVFIEPPQKLADAEVLCVYRNIRHMVKTSDQFKFTQLRGFYRKLLGISEGRVGTSDPRLELPTHVFLAGRGPFVGQNTALPMGVRTSDPYCIFQV